MPEIFTVSDVDEAIDLASSFRRENRYDLFRGQVRSEWLPYPSLMRLQMNNPEAWEKNDKPQIIRFCNWLQNTPGLEEISQDTDAIFAVAQHYGLPTHYLDFTTDPAVAGFFAADTESHEQNFESCILCLDSVDLLKMWKTLRRDPEDSLVPDIALLRPNVANLWRLQAQAGVFLYVTTNWEIYYPMDRIVFPYKGYPSFPTKSDIYPERKSQLEILLDQFFDNERKLEGSQRIRAWFDQISKNNPNVFSAEANDQPLGYLPKYMKHGQIDLHKSWESLGEWLQLSEEAHADVWRRDVPITVDFTLTPSELALRFANGARRAMERDRSLRKHSITWKVETSSNVVLRPTLSNGLSTLWDGLRSLPCEDAEIAQALGNWLGLYVLGYDLQTDVDARQSIFSQLLGPSIHVEFGAPDGSSAMGYVAISALQAALRSDLPEMLSVEVKDRVNDLHFLLQVITSPRHLFNFQRLAYVFVTQIGPSQMTRSAPFVLNPARLGVFGLP